MATSMRQHFVVANGGALPSPQRSNPFPAGTGHMKAASLRVSSVSGGCKEAQGTLYPDGMPCDLGPTYKAPTSPVHKFSLALNSRTNSTFSEEALLFCILFFLRLILFMCMCTSVHGCEHMGVGV